MLSVNCRLRQGMRRMLVGTIWCAFTDVTYGSGAALAMSDRCNFAGMCMRRHDRDCTRLIAVPKLPVLECCHASVADGVHFRYGLSLPGLVRRQQQAAQQAQSAKAVPQTAAI